MRNPINTIIFLVAFLFAAGISNAQQVKDVIYLKDGSKYKGQILRQDSLGLLVKILGDNVIRVPYKSLSHVEKDSIVATNQNSPKENERETEVSPEESEKGPPKPTEETFEEKVGLKKGVAGEVMFGFAVGRTISAHLKFNLGYNINTHFYLGGSFGLDGYEGTMLAPALLQRYYIGPAASVFHPYVWAEEAFLVHSSRSFEDRPAFGSEFKLGIGARFNLAPNFGLGMQVGYGYLSLKEKYQNSGWGFPFEQVISHNLGRLNYTMILFF